MPIVGGPGSLIGEFSRAAATAEPDTFWIWVLVGLAASLSGVFFTFRSLHRARLIENTPTSLVRSAAQGYVELDGSVRLLPGPDVVSPLSGVRCCWWRYRIEHRESRWVGRRRQSEWRTIASGTSDELFLFADHTGECVVDPEGATVYPSLTRRWQGSSSRPTHFPERTPLISMGNYRYSEELLHIGSPLYALGWFRTQSHHHERNEAADVGDLLREWKSDRRRLLQRFDRNADGEIDMAEWEAVRRAAVEHVRAEHLDQALDPDVHVLCQPADSRPFLLSAVPERHLTRSMRRRALLWALVAVIAGGAAAIALHARELI